MPKIKRSRKKKSSLAMLATLAAVVLVGLAYLLWNTTGENEPAIKEAVQQEEWQNALPSAEKETIPPSPELPAAPEIEPPSLEAQQPGAAPVVPRDDPCQRVCSQVDRFFESLDRQGYLQASGVEGKSREHFGQLLEKALAKPPVVVRETDSLITILQNTAHFYRVFGRQDLQLVKTVLEHESERLEPMAALFYEWTLLEPECRENHDLELPLPDLYEYAGFFLNTLGGQSYLFRRDPRTRLLTKYYSVLIIDRANEQGINRYGFDLRPMIDAVIAEMEGSQNLAFREKYLEILRELQFEYYTRYGGPE